FPPGCGPLTHRKPSMNNRASRRINFKAILILLLSLAALGTLVHFGHGFQVKRNAAALKSQAALTEDRDKKIQYLAHYIGFVPNDTDPLVDFAAAIDERAKERKSVAERLRALFLSQKVIVLDPDQHAIRRKLIDAAYDLAPRAGDASLLSQAVTHLHDLLKV